MYNHSTPEVCSIRSMAQVSMLDTSQSPTQSNCQQYVRTNNTVCYVGPTIRSAKLRSRYDGYHEHGESKAKEEKAEK